MLRSASVVALMETLLSGIFITKTSSVSSKDTLTVLLALTSLMKEPNYGLEVWTTQSGHGISEKEDNYSNTTSHHKYSRSVIVLLMIGWQLGKSLL
jgi:hypothetical protein